MSTPLHPSNGAPTEHSPKFHIANQQPRPLWQDVCIGSISALAVMPFIQPMTYFKNVQQSRSITFLKCLKENPRAWYRGLLGSTAFFAPTIAVQTAVQDLFATVMHPILAASASGAFSAIVVLPCRRYHDSTTKDRS